MIIDTNFNLNVLLQFFFSLMLANNNLPLKIYCENIVIAFLNFNLLFLFFFPYISFYSFLLFFPPLFFSSTHVPLLFFSFFPSFLFFPTTSSAHAPLLFFFISFFPLFPYHFLHTPEHSTQS